MGTSKGLYGALFVMQCAPEQATSHDSGSPAACISLSLQKGIHQGGVKLFYEPRGGEVIHASRGVNRSLVAQCALRSENPSFLENEHNQTC